MKKEQTMIWNTSMKQHILYCAILIIVGCANKAELGDNLTSISSEYTIMNKPPGLAISVIKDGEVFWSYTHGYSDIAGKTTFDSKSIMNIGSVSKTITTTAILQLWERGKLKLDTDIQQYVGFKVNNPNFKNTPITIEHLLTHTSSISDSRAYSDSYQCGPPKVSLHDWLRNYFTPEGSYFDKTANFHPWEPGKDYKYSNVAYGLLGLIVEKVSAQPFDVYCENNILTPLKMNNSGWFRKDIDTLQQAKQYVFSAELEKKNPLAYKLVSKKIDNFHELCTYSFYNYPDGLFKTSIENLSRFMLAMMQGGKYGDQKILQTSTVDKALSLQLKNNNIQGLGWKKINHENFSLWGHSGRDPGVRTHMYFHLETNIGIILFQNNDEGSTLKLIEKIYESIRKHEKQ